MGFWVFLLSRRLGKIKGEGWGVVRVEGRVVGPTFTSGVIAKGTLSLPTFSPSGGPSST